MEKFVLNGGIPLRGEVSISGAKNAVVAILPATILAQDICTIENIPNISDVYYMTKILLYTEDLFFDYCSFFFSCQKAKTIL